MTKALAVTASFGSAAACTATKLASSNVEVKVAYVNPYEVPPTAKCATPLPQTDAFAYFYYDSKENPEVFTKALDFGADYKIFYGGLTDFGVSAFFRNVSTGAAKVFAKEPKTYLWDGGSLPK